MKTETNKKSEVQDLVLYIERNLIICKISISKFCRDRGFSTQPYYTAKKMDCEIRELTGAQQTILLELKAEIDNRLKSIQDAKSTNNS